MTSSRDPVSVVIPTRNRPELVVRAVRRTLAQSHAAIEVIVVIDGPDPATAGWSWSNCPGTSAPPRPAISACGGRGADGSPFSTTTICGCRTSSPASYKTYKRPGWLDLGTIPTWIRPLDLERCLAAGAASQPTLAFAARIAQPTASALAHFRALAIRLGGMRLVEVPAFDERSDALRQGVRVPTRLMIRLGPAIRPLAATLGDSRNWFVTADSDIGFQPLGKPSG